MNASAASTAPAPRPPARTSRPVRPVLQLRSSAGLYGADRMVLALGRGLAGLAVPGALLNIRNYLLDAQALHRAAVAAGLDAVLLPCRGRVDMRTVAALRRELDARDAGVLHVHDYKSAFYGWLATRQRDVRLVATLHGWVEVSSALRLYNSLELTLLRRFDALVTVAQGQCERLLHAGVASSRIHCIDNGIDLSPFLSVLSNPAGARQHGQALRASLGLGAAGKVFAAIGRLSPEKNLRQLLDAFVVVAAADAGARLLLVGDGPERGMLEAHAVATGLGGCVLFTGTRTDVADIHPLLDVLVLPSLSEGMPLVVLEAMAQGVPVIANAVGEVPRLLSQTTYGRVLPPGDEAALRGALLDELALPWRRDPRGAAHVRSQHSAEAMARRYLELYETLPARAPA